MASRTVSTVAEEVLPRNRLRKSWVIQNEDASISVFLKQERTATPTVSATDHDHRLASGASIALSEFIDGKEAVQDRWTIVAASGTPRISLFDTEEIVR
jgi:hypothetical protein